MPGHLIYGATTAFVFLLFERRYTRSVTPRSAQCRTGAAPSAACRNSGAGGLVVCSRTGRFTAHPMSLRDTGSGSAPLRCGDLAPFTLTRSMLMVVMLKTCLVLVLNLLSCSALAAVEDYPVGDKPFRRYIAKGRDGKRITFYLSTQQAPSHPGFWTCGVLVMTVLKG